MVATAVRAVRVGPVATVVRVRPLVVCLVLGALAAAAFCFAIATGDYPISLGLVLRELSGSTDYQTWFVVNQLRLPRAWTGFLVGAAFGVSGAVFQTVTRNALAAPDVIGITEGAGTAVVAGIVLGFGAGLGTQTLGLLGGLLCALTIYLLAWKRGTTGYRIILVGIGVSAICTSLTDFLMTQAYLFEAQQAMGWLVGNLNARGWEHVRPVGAALGVLLPVLLVLNRWLRTLQLGDDLAAGLGVPVHRARLALMLAAVGLVAFATAAAGPVLFVGLVAPQIAQRLAKAAAPPLIASGLAGALMVLVSDILAQRLTSGAQLPVGVVTGALGAPFLLWLLVRTNRVGTGG